MINKLKNKIIISENGCWVWQGATKGFGYGYLTVGSRKDGTRKTSTAHREMYSAVYGEIKENLWVLHKCDNPRCINPEHLYLGNREDNTRDRETRLRNKIPKLSGEKHPMSKLTWKDVENIRDIKGKTQREISEMFNVSRETIKDIISYKTWTQPPTEKNDE